MDLLKRITLPLLLLAGLAFAAPASAHNEPFPIPSVLGGEYTCSYVGGPGYIVCIDDQDRRYECRTSDDTCVPLTTGIDGGSGRGAAILQEALRGARAAGRVPEYERPSLPPCPSSNDGGEVYNHEDCGGVTFDPEMPGTTY